MNFWKLVWKALVAVRNALNVCIAYARSRAYPKAEPVPQVQP